ncbi:MAG: tetratricopeptide repeat protein [Candidatus Auribacter fodinae]|jgi:tetratricopeptide (TPR) repeat protein|uniref:Tetratricopeptide repeat protein n=1 Tax=Candidatus Auribacter fodinae TaxID=2093366 RepID=A0A3A4R0B2_9BACT|nr:MAG: tetratricopeptide repeat protein [Candidatus Auribacter fodinae]
MGQRKNIYGAIILFIVCFTAGIAVHLATVCSLTGLIIPRSLIITFASLIIGAGINAAGYAILLRRGRRLFTALGFLYGLLFPVAGNISVLGMYLYKRLFPVKNKDLKDDDILVESYVITDPAQQDSRPLKEEDFIRDSLDIESFSDILRSDNMAMKRSVIEKLSRKDTPDAIMMLQESLKDPDIEIRFYASSALKKIEENFQTHIFSLKEKIKSDPFSQDYNMALSEEYFKFCRSGLLDKSSRTFYLDKSWDVIQNALKSPNSKVNVLLQAGKVALARNDYAEALRYFDKAYEMTPENWQILIWRCEAYFHLGQITEIKDDCHRIEELKPPWDSVKNVTKYWVEHAG